MPMRALWGSTSLVLFLAVGAAFAQNGNLRFFIPNASPTHGPVVSPPFFGFQEVSYLMVLERDRLPTRSVAMVALHLIPTGPGPIIASKFQITIGEAPFRFPDAEFAKNLNNPQVVFEKEKFYLEQTNQLFTFKFDQPYVYRGRRHLAVEIRFHGFAAGLRFRGASSRVHAVYAYGQGAYGARRGDRSSTGMKAGLDALTSMPTITSTGSCEPGSTLDLNFNASTSNIGEAYLAGCAFTTSPGIDIGEYTIPLNPDGLFFSVWWLPTVFQGFEGTIGNFGVGRGRIAIPKEPKLVGVSFAIAFVTLSNTSKITNVSLEHWVTIGMGCGG